MICGGRPVLHAPHQFDELRMQPMDAHFEAGLVAFFLEMLLHVLLDLLHDLLDAGGVNTPVRDQFLEGETSDLTPVGIVGGDQDRFRRIVHDEIHAGVQLEGADVSPLAADDAPLHVVGGQVHDGHRCLHGVVGGQTLDGRGQDFPRLDLGRLLGLLLEPHAEKLGLPAGLDLHLRHELALRLVGGQPGNALQLAALLVEGRAEAGFRGHHALVTLAERAVAGLELLLAPVELV